MRPLRGWGLGARAWLQLLELGLPFIHLPSSPLAPGAAPVRIHYREHGPTSARVDAPRATAGKPVMFLHGGWGYEIYPIDRQLAALSDCHVVIPDRTGYGLSGRLARQECDFHSRAAGETFGVIDALRLERPVLWGHSDGAVIALLMALSAPERLGGVILEAAHFYREKPSSREFFETMRDDPDKLGERVAAVLAREHGDSWREVIRINGVAWLQIAAEKGAGADLYGGRLNGVPLPVLVVHGGRDPRTEPGELDALRRALPGAAFEVLPEGGHSPHSERATADQVTDLVRRFLATLASSRAQHAAS